MMLDNLNKIISSGNYPPVLFLFGDEDFLLGEAFTKLITGLVKPGDEYDYDHFEGDSSTLDKIVSSCLAYPFSAEKRVVVIKNIEKLFTKSVKNRVHAGLSKYLESPNPSTILIIITSDDSLNGIKSASRSNKPDKLNKIMKSLKFPFDILINKHSWLEFGKISDKDITTWAVARFEAEGRKIQYNAAELLVSSSNNSLRELNGEIEKILIYVNEKPIIDINDVSYVSGFSRNYNVFELQKAVSQRNLPLTIDIMTHILEFERAEVLILTIISRYFISLLKLTEAIKKYPNQWDLAKETGINYYFLNEYIASLKKYSQENIENSIILIAEADEKLKSTSAPGIYLLQDLFTRIMG